MSAVTILIAVAAAVLAYLIGGVGLLIIGIAATSIIGVMVIVMQEKHEHEEHYIPPAPSDEPVTSTDAPRTE